MTSLRLRLKELNDNPYIRPLSKGGNRDFDNLQLLHWRNNKYKGEDYPVCRTCVSSDGNVNIEKIRIWQIE